jgi:hypothetical protein
MTKKSVTFRRKPTPLTPTNAGAHTHPPRKTTYPARVEGRGLVRFRSRGQVRPGVLALVHKSNRRKGVSPTIGTPGRRLFFLWL